ncbi:MAG: hypothetical protein WAV90_14335, partial [Gordonia amarae]
VKLVTALFFDLGIYMIVVGLVLDVLRSLGARLDVENVAEPNSPAAPRLTVDTGTGTGPTDSEMLLADEVRR